MSEIFHTAQLLRRVRSSRNPSNSTTIGARFTLLSSVELLLGYKEDSPVPWVRRLVADLLPRRSGFDPRPVHVESIVEKVALVQFFLLVLFPPVSIILPLLHCHSLT